MRRPRCCAAALGTGRERPVLRMSEYVGHMVPIGFFVFMRSMGVALLERCLAVKGVTEV